MQENQTLAIEPAYCAEIAMPDTQSLLWCSRKEVIYSPRPIVPLLAEAAR